MRLLAPFLLLGACDSGTYHRDTDAGDDDDAPATVSEPPPDLQCDPPFDTPDPGGEGAGTCVTQVIQCGDTIQGTNAGGSTVFGAEPGQAFATCAGGSSQTTELDGPERVYELTLPYGTRDLQVRLKSCERSLLLWYQGDACATSEVSCSYAPYGTWYDQYSDVALQNTGSIFLVVEGAANDGGNFELTVDCYY